MARLVRLGLFLAETLFAEAVFAVTLRAGELLELVALLAVVAGLRLAVLFVEAALDLEAALLRVAGALLALVFFAVVDLRAGRDRLLVFFSIKFIFSFLVYWLALRLIPEKINPPSANLVKVLSAFPSSSKLSCKSLTAFDRSNSLANVRKVPYTEIS